MQKSDKAAWIFLISCACATALNFRWFKEQYVWFYLEMKGFAFWYVALAKEHPEIGVVMGFANLCGGALTWFFMRNRLRIAQRQSEFVSSSFQTLQSNYRDSVAQLRVLERTLEERNQEIDRLEDRSRNDAPLAELVRSRQEPRQEKVLDRKSLTKTVKGRWKKPKIPPTWQERLLDDGCGFEDNEAEKKSSV